jgi:hypothetical protein
VENFSRRGQRRNQSLKFAQLPLHVKKFGFSRNNNKKKERKRLRGSGKGLAPAKGLRAGWSGGTTVCREPAGMMAVVAVEHQPQNNVSPLINVRGNFL